MKMFSGSDAWPLQMDDTDPKEGAMYYHTNEKQYYIREGAQWKPMIMFSPTEAEELRQVILRLAGSEALSPEEQQNYYKFLNRLSLASK